MLAAISPSAHIMSSPIPYTHSPTPGTSLLDSGSPVENKVCPGCHLTVMDENGGVVIAFGQSFFHIDCFKCAKCHDRVTADTNLLLLSDGQPVCSNCSYSCSVCHEPILDEAIMTGDDSYHAHCFKCRSCHNRIDELMFAKTSHGIYCMKCHHQRVARSRRHAQKQKERENAAIAGGPSMSHGHFAKDPSGVSANTPDSARSSLPMSTASRTSQASPTRPIPPALSESGDNYRSQARSSLNGRASAQLERDGRRSTPHTPTASAPPSQRASRNPLPSPTSPSLPSARTEPSAPSRYSTDPSSPAIVVPEAPEAGPQVSTAYLQRDTPNNSSPQSFLSPDVPTSIERRRSYDDGTRPLNVLFKNDAPPNLSESPRRSDRASKRNSINPGTTFNYEAVAAESYKPTSAPDSPLSNVPLTSDTDRAMIQTDTHPLASKEQVTGELSSQPSRKTRADIPASASPVTSSRLSRSRSRTESAPKPSVDFARPPLRQNMMLERIPPRTHSLNTSSQDLQAISRRLPPVASVKNGTSGRASFDEKDKLKHGYSLSIDIEKSQAGYGKRPTSPAHQATSPAHKVDVPRGIESGTDTSDEPSADEQNTQPLPPKGKETKSRPHPIQLDHDMQRSVSQDGSSLLGSAGDADSEEESSPVERVSRSTFIAPAHPPIRVSISANGFQELLSLVNPRNRSSLQSIEELVKLNHDAAAHLDSSRSSLSLNNSDGNVGQSEGRRSTSPASATTPTTLGSSSIADNASVTTISAPSSHGHGESFMVMDQHEKPNGVISDSLSPSHQLAVHDAFSTSSNGPSPDVSPELLTSGDQRVRLDQTASRHTDADGTKHGAHITITAPDSVPRPAKPDPSYTVTKRLRDALQEAARRSTTQIVLDQEFVQGIIMTIEQRRDENAQMKGKLDHIKRASKHAMDGLTVAHVEYEAELKARHEAEAEVTRLRVLLSGQAARITALTGEGRRDELHKQLTRELSESLSVLEQNVSKLKVERDVALVEMEEITLPRSLVTLTGREDINISSSLSTRLDNLKAQYQGELVPLTDKRESLLREIAELRSARDIFLEETTMLNARNEELAQLNAHYMRRIEAASSEPPQLARETQSLEHQRPAVMLQPSNTANSSFGTSTDESVNSTKYTRAQKPATSDATLRVFKRRGNAKEAAATASTGPDSANEKNWLRHAFQHINVLRLAKCDHCGDKLWGSQFRCQACHMSIHPRCQQHVQVTCFPQSSRRDEGTPVASLLPSMFGRELTEQVRADSRITDKMTPLLVEKCIEAVEATALDYEGIYRKTGGAGQSKLITQLFERGDYSSFDLLDTDRFNDIGSVTSVLKTYFRSLPNPLLTFVLHDEFIFASSVRDPVHKSSKYADLVKQLPTEHYYTLRMLMSHLHRVQEHHRENLMTARNLGVVFGPTLMRSRNPSAEFSDMAGKALTIEWLVENAPTIFPPLSTMH